MKEFMVGLAVLAVIGVLCMAGVLIFPLLLVAGFFLRWAVLLFLVLFAVWLTGKLTLLLLDYFKKREGGKS